MKRLFFAAAFFLLTSFLAAAELEKQFAVGPYLTDMQSDSVTISFRTAEASAAGVEYREKDGKWRAEYDLSGWQIRRDRSLHRITLSGLKPDTEYEYRVVQFPPPERKMRRTERSWRFRTYGAEFKPFRFFVTSDLHVKPGQTNVSGFLKNPKMDEVLFFGSVGDAGTVFHDFEQVFFHNLLNRVLEKYDSALPLQIVRGNHEYWGKESELFMDYFGRGGRGTFGAFTVRQVCFLVLDSGDSFAPSKVLYLPNALRAAQRAWLLDFVKTPAYRDAKYRIVLSHCAVHGPDKNFMATFMQSVIRDVFPADRQPNLWISGHIHNYRRTVPGRPGYYGFVPPAPDKSILCDGNYAYPTVSFDGPKKGGVDCAGAFVSVGEDGIEVEVTEPSGGVIDRFAVDGTGGIRDFEHAPEIRFFPPHGTPEEKAAAKQD